MSDELDLALAELRASVEAGWESILKIASEIKKAVGE